MSNELVETVARVIDAADPDRVNHALCLKQARAAIAAVLDSIDERANIAQRVREMIGATDSQQIALAYAEAEMRAMLSTMRSEALGDGL